MHEFRTLLLWIFYIRMIAAHLYSHKLIDVFSHPQITVIYTYIYIYYYNLTANIYIYNYIYIYTPANLHTVHSFLIIFFICIYHLCITLDGITNTYTPANHAYMQCQPMQSCHISTCALIPACGTFSQLQTQICTLIYIYVIIIINYYNWILSISFVCQGGRTAVDCALLSGNEEIVQALITASSAYSKNKLN